MARLTIIACQIILMLCFHLTLAQSQSHPNTDSSIITNTVTGNVRADSKGKAGGGAKSAAGAAAASDSSSESQTFTNTKVNTRIATSSNARSGANAAAKVKTYANAKTNTKVETKQQKPMTFPPTTPPHNTKMSPNDYNTGNGTGPCPCQNSTTIIQVVCPNCTCPCPPNSPPTTPSGETTLKLTTPSSTTTTTTKGSTTSPSGGYTTPYPWYTTCPPCPPCTPPCLPPCTPYPPCCPPCQLPVCYQAQCPYDKRRTLMKMFSYLFGRNKENWWKYIHHEFNKNLDAINMHLVPGVNEWRLRWNRCYGFIWRMLDKKSDLFYLCEPIIRRWCSLACFSVKQIQNFDGDFYRCWMLIHPLLVITITCEIIGKISSTISKAR